jgi:protein O-GlcNAc transferase
MAASSALQNLVQQGLALQQQGKLEAAETYYTQALKIDPGEVNANHFLGIIKAQQGKADEGLRLINKAVRRAPNEPLILMNYGIVLSSTGRHEDALRAYEKAIAGQPSNPAIWINKGNTLGQIGRLPDALAAYERALALDDKLPMIWNLRSSILLSLSRYGEAAESANRAIILEPRNADAHCNAGLALYVLGRREQAIAHLDTAVNSAGDQGAARVIRCIAELPVLYVDIDEIEQRRRDYTEQLATLARIVEQNPRALGQNVFVTLPYFLTYQGKNDRDLQLAYGQTMCRVQAAHAPAATLAGPPRGDEPIRVGIVSSFFRAHSVWKIPIKGWVSQLDRRRFQLFGYHTDPTQDQETAAARAHFTKFVDGPLPTAAWRQEILRDALHVLIYPELGMHGPTAELAAQRLARIQCVSLGHPTTTGFPTVDYFLSSALMEAPDGDRQYTEKLIKLPNLSIYYEPQETAPTPVERTEIGLRPGIPVYWCGQSLFKYLPQNDHVFARIARQVGACRFLFIDYQAGQHVNELFRKRLKRAFAAYDLDSSDYCTFLPRMSFDRFMATMGLCDVFLDSIEWSGFNTALESTTHNLPIVTMPGALMRGRHSTAVLRMMGVTETIAATTEEYVTIAARLGTDVAWRIQMRERMAQNKHRLYRDRSCIAALEEFLASAVR